MLAQRVDIHLRPIGCRISFQNLNHLLNGAERVLPGGLGTLDELMEVATWNQLSIMRKPVVVVNHRGFFDPLLRLLDHLVGEGFLRPEERAVVQVAENASDALDLLGAPRPVPAAATA